MLCYYGLSPTSGDAMVLVSTSCVLVLITFIAFHAILVLFGIGVLWNSATIGHVGEFGSRTITTFHGMYFYVPSNSCMLARDVFLCQMFFLVYVIAHPRRITVVCLQHILYFTVFTVSIAVTSVMSVVECEVHVLASAVYGLCTSSMDLVVSGTHSLMERLRDISVITVFVNVHSHWVLIAGTQHR